MSIALLTRLGPDAWRVSFYRRERGRLRFSSHVECCWESVLIVMRYRDG